MICQVNQEKRPSVRALMYSKGNFVIWRGGPPQEDSFRLISLSDIPPPKKTRQRLARLHPEVLHKYHQ